MRRIAVGGCNCLLLRDGEGTVNGEVKLVMSPEVCGGVVGDAATTSPFGLFPTTW